MKTVFYIFMMSIQLSAQEIPWKKVSQLNLRSSEAVIQAYKGEPLPPTEVARIRIHYYTPEDAVEYLPLQINDERAFIRYPQFQYFVDWLELKPGKHRILFVTRHVMDRFPRSNLAIFPYEKKAEWMFPVEVNLEAGKDYVVVPKGEELIVEEKPLQFWQRKNKIDRANYTAAQRYHRRGPDMVKGNGWLPSWEEELGIEILNPPKPHEDFTVLFAKIVKPQAMKKKKFISGNSMFLKKWYATITRVGQMEYTDPETGVNPCIFRLDITHPLHIPYKTVEVDEAGLPIFTDDHQNVVASSLQEYQSLHTGPHIPYEYRLGTAYIVTPTGENKTLERKRHLTSWVEHMENHGSDFLNK